MTAAPVILRELRAESRRPATYYARLASAVSAFVLLGLLAAQQGLVSASTLGQRLFYALNLTQFLLIAVLVPVMTSDCVSRERREGTLGLLFLTPLTPLGVVLGKWIIQALRGVALFAATLPISALPYLMGGVGYRDLFSSLLVNASMMLLALGAGIAASSLCRDWVRSIVAALLLCLAFAGGYLLLLWFGFQLMEFLNMPPGARFTRDPSVSPPLDWAFRNLRNTPLFSMARQMLGLATGMDFNYVNGFGGFPEGWARIWSAPSGAFSRRWFEGLGILLGASACVLAAALGFAAWRIRASWREGPPARVVVWTYDTFFRPKLWSHLFHNRLRRTLDANPIGWLHQVSVGARLTKWGWCLLVLLTECVLVLEPDMEGLVMGQYLLALLLVGALGFNASGSFHRELENGAFELLLVTPLREGHLIWGRLRGVWGQFLPSVALLLFVFSYLQLRLGEGIMSFGGRIRTPLAPSLLCALVCVPVIGLCASMLPSLNPLAWLRGGAGVSTRGTRAGSALERGVLANWAACMGVGVALPLAAGLTLSGALFPQDWMRARVAFGVTAGGLQVALAVLGCRVLWLGLRQRRFIVH